MQRSSRDESAINAENCHSSSAMTPVEAISERGEDRLRWGHVCALDSAEKPLPAIFLIFSFGGPVEKLLNALTAGASQTGQSIATAPPHGAANPRPRPAATGYLRKSGALGSWSGWLALLIYILLA